MSIATEVSRLQDAKAAIKAAIEGKGVTVPDGTLLDGMTSLIAAIEAGGTGELFSGTITPSEDTASISIQHNMGRVPKIIFIKTTTYTKGYLSHCIWVYEDTLQIPTYGGTFYSKPTSPPTTRVTLIVADTAFSSSIDAQTAELVAASSAKLCAGSTYTWYMM